MLSEIFNTIKFMLSHPLNRHNKLNAIYRFVKWQLLCLFHSTGIIYPITQNTKVIMRKSMYGATGMIYNGLHEFYEMSFFLHALRKSDCFVDIGANVGIYSILCSKEVQVNTICFEPNVENYEIIKQNISLNEIDDIVTPYNFGLGNKNTTKFITNNLDTINHIVEKSLPNTDQINIKKFDDFIDIKKNTFIKIDAEGYEKNIIDGMQKSLKNSKIKALIIETNGSIENFRLNTLDMHNILLKNKFQPFEYLPFKRALLRIDTFSAHNTLYIRDVQFVKNRLINADNILINNIEF